MKMKRLVNMLVCGPFRIDRYLKLFCFAQTATGAEARLKEANIILPPVPAPLVSDVDSVRVGNLVFLAGKHSRG